MKTRRFFFGKSLFMFLLAIFALSSCDKDIGLEEIDEAVKKEKLGFADFIIGKTYKLSDIKEEVLREMDIDPDNHARAVSYRTRAWYYFVGQATLNDVNLNVNGYDIDLTGHTPNEADALYFTNEIDTYWTSHVSKTIKMTW